VPGEGDDVRGSGRALVQPTLVQTTADPLERVETRVLRDVLGGEAGSEPAVAQSGVRLGSSYTVVARVSRQMVVVSVLIVVLLALASVAAAVSLRGPV
jgi:hypothetical protein